MELDDQRYTENTRSSYPIGFVPNVIASGQAGHPQNVVMLTADAYGAMPPIARLTPEGAMYHFLSGYTARVAGTERGVTEPKATFSTCFGAPFLPLNPNVYAKMLGERIAKHKSRVWLVNTGWTGGPYGVGSRMKIGYTRTMLAAALKAISTASRTGSTGSSTSIFRRPAPACPTPCSMRGPHGRTRLPTTSRRGSLPRCSQRTSKHSRRMWTLP